MSNLGRMAGQGAARIPTPPRGEPIARYETYLEAQRAVDYLSDNAFPVQFVTIVGTGLQMVERVTGRLTYARVAVAGAGSGLYFGFFFGLLLTLFGGASNALVAGPLFGLAFGVLYGVIWYAFTRGRRDFTSTSQIVAGEYAVLCLAEHAGAALQMLRQLPGGTGRGSGGLGSGGPGSGGPGGGAPATVTPAPPYGSEQPTAQTPGGQPAPTPAEPAEPGLTYGEAIERQKRDRQERERLERDRQA
jgi:hypothetical protein